MIFNTRGGYFDQFKILRIANFQLRVYKNRYPKLTSDLNNCCESLDSNQLSDLFFENIGTIDISSYEFEKTELLSVFNQVQEYYKNNNIGENNQRILDISDLELLLRDYIEFNFFDKYYNTFKKDGLIELENSIDKDFDGFIEQYKDWF